MHYKEAIEDRVSVRTFQDKSIPKDLLMKLQGEIYDRLSNSPFDNPLRIEVKEFSDFRKIKSFGTYGVIKGTSSYLVAITRRDRNSLLNLGYIGEQLVLYLTSMGLGSCWLGGTFKRASLASEMILQDDEIIPAIIPFGYSRDRRSFVDKSLRFLAKSDKRLTWHDLYFAKSFDYHLPMDETAPYYEPLEMMRIAPSASNKQPWRVLKEGKTFHFFKKINEAYSKGFGFDMQYIDLGIALCHFDMTRKENGLKGKWRELTYQTPREFEYIISFDMEE